MKNEKPTTGSVDWFISNVKDVEECKIPSSSEGARVTRGFLTIGDSAGRDMTADELLAMELGVSHVM